MIKWLMMTGIALTGACASQIAGTATPSEVDARAGGSVHTHSIAVGERTRWFNFYRSSGLKMGAPLVIMLHGGTDSMTRTLGRASTKDWMALSDRHGFMLLIPNGTNHQSGDTRGNRQHWNDYRDTGAHGSDLADDVRFVRNLIRWATRRHQIDLRRVYVTGASNGGMMTFRLLQDAPEAFTAGAAFIANLPEKTPPDKSRGIPVPLMMVNGTADPLMKWAGGSVGARGLQDRVLSAPATLVWWQGRNKTARQPISQTWLQDTTQDNCHLQQSDYAPKSGGAPIRFVRMQGGGHAVPSTRHPKRTGPLRRRIIGTLCRDANGAAMAWAFFREHGRR